MNIPWTIHNAKKGECLHLQIGLLSVWLAKESREWQITSIYESSISKNMPQFKPKSKPDVTTWQRWITGDKSTQFQLQPRMPDRHLVVKSEYTVQILPGVEITLIIGIPIWLSLLVGKEKKNILTKATVPLSNTWFGEIETGELCYALKSAARHNTSTLEKAFHKAFCPVQIINSSNDPLQFQHFLLPAKNLGIYGSEKHLWTNSVKVNYKGEGKIEQLEVSKSSPRFESPLKTLNKPQEPADNNLVKKTFSGLKSLTEL